MPQRKASQKRDLQTGGAAEPSEGDADGTRARRTGLATKEAGRQQEWGEGGSSSMRHTHRAANTEERRATTERQEKRAGNGAQRLEDGDTAERHRPLELASCAASTGARWDRQQHRDSNMAAKAAEADHKQQREVSEGSGQRDDVRRAPRAHVQEEREEGDSSSSNMGSSSTSCNNTRVHGAHKEGGEMAGRERWQQGRQANAAEQWARTRPRGGDESGSGAAAARTAGEHSAATKEKPVDGSVNTGNTETECIREQRRITLRQDIRRDASKKGARRARYGALPPVTREWLAAQRGPDGLRWPHAWKLEMLNVNRKKLFNTLMC